MKYFKVYPVTQDLFIFCGDRVTSKTFFANKINVEYCDVHNIGLFIRRLGDKIRVNDVSHEHTIVLITNDEETVYEIMTWANNFLRVWNGEIKL